jgi:hypothetical protein
MTNKCKHCGQRLRLPMTEDERDFEIWLRVDDPWWHPEVKDMSEDEFKELKKLQFEMLGEIGWQVPKRIDDQLDDPIPFA